MSSFLKLVLSDACSLTLGFDDNSKHFYLSLKRFQLVSFPAAQPVWQAASAGVGTAYWPIQSSARPVSHWSWPRAEDK